MRKLNLFLSFFLCGSASFLALHKLNYPLIGIDDANIYFVYARNLANGYGFVYNVGGERVEGFTSLLWTIISALAFKFSAYPELTLLIICITIVSLGVAYALDYLQQQALPGKEKKWGIELFWSALFLILLCTSPRYIVWNTITLMENALWSTLLLVTTIFVIRNQISVPAINFGFVPLSILLLLTRPESILWVAVFTAILFLRMASTGNIIDALKDLAPSVVCMAFTLALLTLFRLQYFGYPLPNTYYAKVSPSLAYNLQQGTIYLSKYFISDPIVLLSIIAILISFLHTITVVFSNRIPNDGSFFLPILAGSGLLAPVLAGGDHFGSFRFYQNIYPIEILCLLYFVNRVLPEYIKFIEYPNVSQWIQNRFSLSLALVLAVGVFLSQFYIWNSIASEMDIEFNVADYGRKNGAFIQELFSPLPKLPSLGVVTSGGIKYSYAGEIVDLMGLNNTIMAHNSGDRRGIKNHAAFDINTFYQLQPDVVWPLTVDEDKWQYSESDIKGGWENNEGFKGLFDEPHFQELYVYAKVSSNTENRYALVAWFKKDFLKSAVANTDFLVEEYQYTPLSANKPLGIYKVTTFNAFTKVSTIFSILISSLTIR